MPARSLHELSRVLSDTDDPVDIVLSPSRNQILFHLEGFDLVSRLIDGQFPNYQQVLPKGFTTKATVDRDQLLAAVRLASLIASSSANIVKLQVGKDAEIGVTVSAAADVGDNKSDVEATVEGDGTTIAFNARYLIDVLTNVDADQFSIELNGPLSPGVFRPVPDGQYVHVVMPVKTTSVPARGLATGGSRHGQRPSGAAHLRRSRRRVSPETRDAPSLSGHPESPGLRRARHRVRARPAAHLGTERRGQDDSARGRGPAGAGTMPPDRDRRRADPLGRGLPPDRRPSGALRGAGGGDRDAGAPTRATAAAAGEMAARSPAPSRVASLELTLQAGGRKKIQVNGVPRRPAALAEHLRTVLFAPEEMLLVIGSPALRRAALDGLTAPPRPELRRQHGHLRPGAAAAQQPAAGHSRGRGGPRPAPALGRAASSLPAPRSWSAAAPAGAARGASGRRPPRDRAGRGAAARSRTSRMPRRSPARRRGTPWRGGCARRPRRRSGTAPRSSGLTATT